ncbi:hypothetical protein INT47_006167 [Mucor saturninus]|uniref:DAGKc domain-containing protein n=1 Tax=Mucor saturninus TaxID=64648 RepID=A0A8H7V311_9FUNG|nr:hypothetical protein INT47_006167 [Mucor saturninus]
MSAIHVEKLGKAVVLTYDDQSLLIEGDLDTKKRGLTRTEPTRIINTHILYAHYNDRTNLIQINAVIPDQPTTALLNIYKFMYTVKDNGAKEAIEFCKTIMDSVYKDLISGKRLKILVNPFGGQSKAKDIFQLQVKPILEAAKCILDVQLTEHQSHALEIARDLDIDAYDAIVTVSGDGIIHEVINGFIQRPDAREAMRKVPLGIIPAGTSNSFSISMLGEKQGFDPIYTTLQVIKGRSLAIDLCSINYGDERFFSFLSHSFGISAYADLGTEHMRWMGDTRTVVGLLGEIFKNKKYKVQASLCIVESDKAKLKKNYDITKGGSAWIPVNPSTGAVTDTMPPLNEPVPDNWTTLEEHISFFLTSKVPLLNRGMLSHPYASPNDGLLDLLMVRSGKSLAKQLSVFTNIDTGKHIDLDIVEYSKIKAFRLTPILKPGKTAYVSIDGEHAPVKTFQVEVHPCIGSVLSFSPTFYPHIK